MKELLGQTLGQHKIIEQIGAGGMATVFKAHQSGLNRDVALKVLPPQIAEREGFTERFTREAQAIGNLHHPNILPVYASGHDKGYSYIAMRYIPGARTLVQTMQDAPLAPQKIIHLAHQIAAALDHAHTAGIVHRDVKPSNILMDDDWVFLSDFGLAKAMEQASDLTGTGVGVGTPAYMSPEQAKGEQLDHRTDIYALGIILFEMLTGHIPHKAETPIATVMKRINEPLPSARSLNPTIPAAVESVLVKALAPNPVDRYNRAGELRQALETAFSTGINNITEQRPLAVPIPSETQQPISEPHLSNTSTISQSGNKNRTLDIVITTLLGVVTLCGLSGSVLSFLPNQETGEVNLMLLPMCLGAAIASLTTIGLIWFRRRNTPASAWFAVGVIAWFIGVNILGLGGGTLLNPQSTQSFSEDLGFSLALCFMPGGLLALLGLGLYAFDYRRNLKAGTLAASNLMANDTATKKQNLLAAQAEKLARAGDYHKRIEGIALDLAGGTPSPQRQPPRSPHAEKLARAADYHHRIEDLIKQQRSTFADQFSSILNDLDAWEQHLDTLAERLHKFEQDDIIQRDIKEVPQAIAQLEQKLELETNPEVRTEMEETLIQQRNHKKQLDMLVTIMHRTELDLDETLAAIGSIYSQLQLISAKEIDRNRAKRLSSDIHEQADHLNDLLAAMDEVYESSDRF